MGITQAHLVDQDQYILAKQKTHTHTYIP